MVTVFKAFKEERSRDLTSAGGCSRGGDVQETDCVRQTRGDIGEKTWSSPASSHLLTDGTAFRPPVLLVSSTPGVERRSCEETREA